MQHHLPATPDTAPAITGERPTRHRSIRRLIVTLGIATTSMIAGLVLVAPPAPVAALPFGFSDELVGTAGSPVAVRMLPTGVVAVVGKTGTLRLVRGGAVLPTPALTMSGVCAQGERGMLGVAAGPDLATTGHIYLYATRVAPSAPGGCVNRVSRFTMTGDIIDPASEVVLVDNISSINSNHNGGDIEIGKDGMLWIAVGDAGRDPRGDSGSGGSNDAAQDMSLLNGKILRVDPATGGPAPGNPFSGPGTSSCRTAGVSAPSTTVCQEIYASGLRNPWRLAFDPNAAGVRVFANDVGQGTYEEVNDIVAGGNYGWPTREGPCPQGQTTPCAGPSNGLIDPVTAYGRSLGTYITGGAFVPNGSWPAQYDGAYVFGDGGNGEIWVRSANGAVDYGTSFHTAPGMVDMDFVPESGGLAMYYVSFGSDQVRKVVFPSQADPVPSSPLRYEPLAVAERLFDSRRASDGAAPLAGNTARTISTGVDGTRVRAVLVNIAYVQPRTAGFLTAWANGGARPATSNINALAGETVANAAVVPVDAQGRIQVLTNATADVVVDLLGGFANAPSAVSSGRFVPLTPDRLIDTRNPSSADNQYTERTDAGVVIVNAPLAGRSGTPPTGMSAVVLTVTAVASATDAGGWIAASPGGAPRPPISNLNSNGRGDIRPNLVVVPVGADGTIDLHLFAVSDVVVDVAGYFTDATAPAATVGRFRVLATPYREADTRSPYGFARFDGPSTRTLDPVAVPGGAIGVVHNLTIVNNTAAGFLTAHPDATRPLASTANASGPNQLRAASAFTRLGAGGSVRYFAMMPTDLVVDVTGWFEGPA